MDRRDILMALPVFAGLSERDWDKVIDLFSERQYQKDDYIFLEGEAPEALYVVKTGKIKVLRHSTDGKDVVLRVVSPGQMLGSVAVFDGGGYPGTAQAIEHCSLLVIARNDCLTLVTRYPVFALAVINDMGTRLRGSAEQIRSLAVERVEQRIARVLLKLGASAGADTPDGRVIEMPLTRQDVADMTGTTVETAIRVMSKFRRQEFIRTRRGKVVLVDLDALQDVAEAG
ncbi:MAG: Anaerobic regulatory protein [Chloroflexi bacterium ADurb.Bin325]|nr:MAG: Anaerobic regulatory protein [Chloroflexi bacterium ADurb.Bin325]